MMHWQIGHPLKDIRTKSQKKQEPLQKVPKRKVSSESKTPNKQFAKI